MFDSFLSDYSNQYSATTAAHIKRIISMLKIDNLFSLYKYNLV